MSANHLLFQPSLRRRIEAVLDDTPDGLSACELADRLVAAAAGGGPAVGRQQLLRQLGLLLVEGRVDESDGIWTACDPQPMTISRQTHGKAA
jgi:hypothetical protein